MKKATQYQMSQSAITSQVQDVLPEIRVRKTAALAKLRDAYSFPVKTGFLWFKKERPATSQEIDERVRRSRSQFTGDFDYAWVAIWRLEEHITALEAMLAAAQIPGVQTVLVSQRDMDIINLYKQ